MTQEVARKPLSRTARLVLFGVLVGLAFGIPASTFAHQLWQRGKEGAVPNNVGAEDKEAEAAFQRMLDGEIGHVLPRQLTVRAILAQERGTFTKLEFAGTAYLVLDISPLGLGVAHKHIGLYAPDKDGVFHLSLIADSWAAGHIEAAVDKDTGILELRERANSKLKGQLVLSCNLRTIGTQHSTWDK